MLRILAFDTAMRACSAALWGDGRVIAQQTALMERGQSEALMPMVQEVLQEAGVRFAEIDALAVTVGPGAFTGLRIGLAAARGIALAAKLPVFGVTTLAAVAQGIPENERSGKTVLVTLDTKRADLYVQAFSEKLIPQSEPQAVLPSALSDMLASTSDNKSVVLAGDAKAIAQQALNKDGVEVLLSAAPDMPDAVVVAALAAERWQQDQRPSELPQPLYLRPPDVTQPRK